MNFTDSKSGIIYTSSILGNNLSVAVGVAKTSKETTDYYKLILKKKWIW